MNLMNNEDNPSFGLFRDVDDDQYDYTRIINLKADGDNKGVAKKKNKNLVSGNYRGGGGGNFSINQYEIETTEENFEDEDLTSSSSKLLKGLEQNNLIIIDEKIQAEDESSCESENESQLSSEGEEEEEKHFNSDSNQFFTKAGVNKMKETLSQ